MVDICVPRKMSLSGSLGIVGGVGAKIVMVVSVSQLAKHRSPILVTPLGIVISGNDASSSKTFSPKLVIPIGNVIAVSESQN